MEVGSHASLRYICACGREMRRLEQETCWKVFPWRDRLIQDLWMMAKTDQLSALRRAEQKGQIEGKDEGIAEGIGQRQGENGT